MPLQPGPEIEKLPSAYHGGLNYAELKSRGLDAGRVLDFSVCCNPYPPTQAIRDSLRWLDLSRYPDSEAGELKNKIAEKLGLSPANVMVGSGTTELIRLIAQTYLRRGDRVLVFKPTYGEYELSSRLFGAEVIEYTGKAETNFYLPVEDFAGYVRKLGPRAVFLGNPNNPTGRYLSEPEIKTILKSCGEGLLVLDEAYINFVDRPWLSTNLISHGNVIILRSMTKDYALAGLRLGYIFASEEIIRTMRRACPPWNVNIAAQKAGVAALESADWLKESLRKIRQSGTYLKNGLLRLGYQVLPSDANFFLVKVGDGKAFREKLLNEGILVRDCTSFGLPEYIRVAPRTLADCRKLIQAVTVIARKKNR